MDIGTVVVVLMLIVLFFGGAVWMEIHSRKTGSKGRFRERNRLESNETENQKQHSPLLTLLGLDTAALSKTRADQRKS
jgi:hypothetical protein